MTSSTTTASAPRCFRFLPRLAGKKTVVTVQGLDWQRAKWGRIASAILRWGEAAAVKLPDATMVVSRTLQQYYRDQYRRDTIYVPNGATIAARRASKATDRSGDSNLTITFCSWEGFRRRRTAIS